LEYDHSSFDKISTIATITKITIIGEILINCYSSFIHAY